MKNNTLALVTITALLVNVAGFGIAPLPAAAGPAPSPSPASLRALPAWFSTAPGDRDQIESTDPETVTDAAGRYRFAGLPHGTHKVTLNPNTLPPSLRPAEGESVPILWVTPGMELSSVPLSTGVRFTAAYDRTSGDISGLVFLDQDGDGQFGLKDIGLPGVRVIDPTLHQYFVPFDDHNLWTLFADKEECYGYDAYLPLHSYIFLTTGSDDTVYYYDHWEDEYDADPLNPGSTTEVGILDAGATQIFQSDIYTATIGSGPPYYYDGRDRITIVGEEAAVVRLAYPDDPGTILAAAWEIQEVADWGTEYVATVGEDLPFTTDHQYTGLEVMAWLDGTAVYRNGVLEDTLNAGQTVFIRGGNDGAGGGGVDSGDTITATWPVQVQMVTGNCQSPGVSAHGYTLQPVDVWDSAYWAPVPGFLPGCGPSGNNADSDIYLHNNHASPITVTVSSNSGTYDIGIPANSTVSVLNETGWGDISTGHQGVHFTSADTFWGLAVVDSATNGASNSEVFDWAYALVSASELSSQVVVGYAPGNGDPAPGDNGNLAFVTAVTDTVVYVDLNQDGLPDPFDMNGDGDRNDYDAWGENGWDEPTSALGVPLAAGQVLRVGDPADHNLMGALIYTLSLEEKIAVAWGQDPCAADTRSPYLDLGYTILPVSIPHLSKVDEMAIDADMSGGVSPGDTITYTLVLHNNGMGAMTNVVLTDALPYTYTSYVTGTLRVTTPPLVDDIEYSNDGVDFTALENPDIQALRVTWLSVEPDQTVTTTFRVRLDTDIPPEVTEITNQAVVDSDETAPRLSEDPDDPPDPDTDTPVARPLLSIDKRVTPAIIRPGERVTYTMVVSNYGNGVALLTAITDVLPSSITYVPDTLNLTWPVAQVTTTDMVVSDTTSFHGYYADDFDLTATQGTYYAGNDGSLSWSTNWVEVDDDGDPLNGEVQAPVDGDALSEPSHLWIWENGDGDDAGTQRGFNLSQFREPWLRYHVSGTNNLDGNDIYRVEINGLPETQEEYNGEYTVREVDLSTYAGDAAVTVGLRGTGNLDAGEYYRLDHIAIYEADPQRTVPRTITFESLELSYRTTTGGNPFSYNPLNGHMVITQGMRLPAGGTFTVTLQAQAAAPLTDALTLANTACTTATNWLQVQSAPCDDAEVLVQSDHTLSITKSAAPSPAASGRLLTYTITYTMAGSEPVESMVVSDTTPVSTTFFSATPAPVSDPGQGNTGPVIWEVPGLWPPGSGATETSGTLNLVVLLDSSLVTGTLIYNAVTVSDTTDLTDTDEITTPVYTAADLAISKIDDPDPVVPGTQVTYTLAVVNNGPDDAEGVVVTDTLPPQVTFVDATRPVVEALPDLIWSLGTMTAGEVRYLTVTALVNLDVTEPFTNTALVSSDTYDPDPDDNHDDEVTRPPMPGLDLVKTVRPERGSRGTPFTTLLRISNTGDFTFTTMRLTDTLPSASFRYVNGSGTPASPDFIAGPSLVWFDLIHTTGPLIPGASVTVTFQFTATPDTIGDYTNTATVEGTYLPGASLTDTDDAPLSIGDPAVAVDKRLVGHDQDDVSPNYVTFTIVITNVGPSTIDVLPLQDEYDPYYLSFVSATMYPEENADDGLVSWHDLTGPTPNGFDLNLAPDETFAIDTVFRVVHDITTTVNTAIVDGAVDVYGNPADEVEDDEVITENIPTAAELLYFRVGQVDGRQVQLEWATAVEVDNFGFNLYRSAEADRSRASLVAFVPSQARGGGADYAYADTVPSDGMWWYWLADVDTSGQETFHGPIGTGVGPDAWRFRYYLPVVMK